MSNIPEKGATFPTVLKKIFKWKGKGQNSLQKNEHKSQTIHKNIKIALKKAGKIFNVIYKKKKIKTVVKYRLTKHINKNPKVGKCTAYSEALGKQIHSLSNLCKMLCGSFKA